MSFRKKIEPKRRVFLSLVHDIDSGLRGAYNIRYAQGRANQSSVAKKLKVNRSLVNRRLTGNVNLTLESIADMVWALDHAIEVKIFDPEESKHTNHFRPGEPVDAPVPQPEEVLGNSEPKRATDILPIVKFARVVAA